MVYFECDQCHETLKKKQILVHYQFKCKGAHSFSCLTCFKHFDRESIVAHTSCVTEDEKYMKGDVEAQMKKKMQNTNNLKDNIDSLDFSSIEWNGFTKTSKSIISMINIKKIKIERLVKEIVSIYAKYKKVDPEDVDEDLVRKGIEDKVYENTQFAIDLSKNTIRLK